MYFTYLLRCADGSLYAGSTRDLETREARHNEGRGGRYTTGRRPVHIVYSESFDTLQLAMARERELKRWTKAKKEALLSRALLGRPGRARPRASSGVRGRS